MALQRAGAAVAVDTADGLAARWLAWIEGDAERCRQGALARALVARGRGAAERSADLLDALLAR